MRTKIIQSLKILISVLSGFLPAWAFAQQDQGVKGLIVSFGGIVKLLIPISAACALLFFFWGLAKFILNVGSEGGQEEGRQVMKWGIIALFIIVSIWGIVGFIQSDLGIPDINSLTAPSIR